MRPIDADMLKAEFAGNFCESYPTAEVRALIDTAPTITPTPHWISVEERLPENKKKCLIYRESGTIKGFCFGRYNIKNGVWDCGVQNILIHGVTHWMPLPEPPKEAAP